MGLLISLLMFFFPYQHVLGLSKHALLLYLNDLKGQRKWCRGSKEAVVVE